jgi:hypothetical protein
MKPHRYTPEEIQFINDNINGRSYADMTCLFNREFNLSVSKTSITKFLHRHKLSNNRKPGIPTFLIKRSPIGTERIETNGYTRVKIAEPSVWKEKHVLIWEAANGPIPEGHFIVFADGDRSNMDPGNLLLVSSRELVTMNNRHLIFPDAGKTKCGLMIARIIILANDCVRNAREGGA